MAELQTNSNVKEYEILSDIVHVLKRPDTFVGSLEKETVQMFIPECIGENVKMISKSVTFVPAFFKIFDEILVNAADNKMRNNSTDTIKVEVNQEKRFISVFNNGKGIPVKKQDNLYIPEMVFGHFRSGSNFKDNDKKTTGGRNGYGAKLTNAFSTEFIVETHDSSLELSYKQVWKNNMGHCKEPVIKKSKKTDFTKITFYPDFKRFHIDNIDNDTFLVFKKRVYDLTGSLRNVKVYFNNEKVKNSSFKDYVYMYLGNNNDVDVDMNSVDDNNTQTETQTEAQMDKPKIVYEKFNDRWEVALALSESGNFSQVSFVNSIATTNGGTHVAYVVDQIVNQLLEIIKKKHKNIVVKPQQIKNQLFLFVNCVIEEPSFSSQTKETMTLNAKKFGSVCNISESFIKKITKLGIIEETIEMAKQKEQSQLKKTDGVKKVRLSGILKLDDANNAGSGKKSKDCTLFLTEGDSAKTFAVTGIPVVKNGRDIFGAYPLRGKLLNIRDASTKQILENKEITQLNQILGLQTGKVYTNTDSLRYGSVCILVDSDVDGKHIKGLVMNWLETCFPSLLKIPGFLCEFISPIVKCTKNKQEMLFYSLHEYQKWKTENNNGKNWQIKYFKGLGTSKAEDIKSYFKNINTHMKRPLPLTKNDSEKLDMVFNKKRADDRKKWLKLYNPNNHIELTDENYSISDFVDKDFIEFSMYDNVRSIPSLVDGLKPGQRKILFTAIKTKMTSDVKVAQFAGEVGKMTEYRHGEQSLCETIIGMAQTYVGSNNIALLSPEGSFGTRLQGGKDAASPRYIYTKLEETTRLIFSSQDDEILNYLQEDGYEIEPQYYVPIIPMILVNGGEGIGTGYSTTVLSYNPQDIITQIKNKLRKDEEFTELVPWYNDFEGTITKGEENQWVFTGILKKTSSTQIEITELPVSTWVENYKMFLETLVESGKIKDYKEYHTDTKVHFVVKLTLEEMEKLDNQDMLSVFKMKTTKKTSNMMLFDKDNCLKKYDTTVEIIKEFYNVRLDLYTKRKNHQLSVLKKQLEIAENKQKFISSLLSKKIVIDNKSRKDVENIIETNLFMRNEDSYDYLLNMSFSSMTKERIETLRKECQVLRTSFTEIQEMSEKTAYLNDLEKLEKVLL